jgi:hypothetical protein
MIILSLMIPDWVMPDDSYNVFMVKAACRYRVICPEIGKAGVKNCG